MIRPIRIKAPANTFFVSDPHFNHAHPEVLRMRSANTVEELNANTARMWNERIPADADVWMLGDFCLHDPDGTFSKHILRELNGRVIHMLWGNHNSGVKQLYRETLARQIFPDRPRHALNYELYPLRASFGGRVVEFVGRQVDLIWGRQEITLNHFAARQWLHKGRGAWMLCGHSHGNDPAIASTEDTGIGKILETGFDTTGPISLLEVADIMARKNISPEGENKC